MRHAYTVQGWLPPGLNGSEGLIRMHHRARKRKLEECMLHLWNLKTEVYAAWGGPITVPVRVWYTRRSTNLMDWDNAAASFKTIGDALVRVGILEDDSPRHITQFFPQQDRAKKRVEGGFTIEIETEEKTK